MTAEARQNSQQNIQQQSHGQKRGNEDQMHHSRPPPGAPDRFQQFNNNGFHQFNNSGFQQDRPFMPPQQHHHQHQEQHFQRFNQHNNGAPFRKSIEVYIPPGKAGLIIGKGGETLKGIGRQFNVRVQLDGGRNHH